MSEVLNPFYATTDQLQQNLMDKIHNLANMAFKKHELKLLCNQELFRSWHLSSPGTSVCYFDITTIPGSLFITGDIGDLILTRESDMISWARKAVGSIEYFASKVPNEIQTREYDPEVAKAWIYEMLQLDSLEDEGDDVFQLLGDSTREALLEIYRDQYWDYGNEYETMLAIHDSGVLDGCDIPNLTNYTSNFLWCREALLFFFTKLDQTLTPGPEPIPDEVG